MSNALPWCFCHHRDGAFDLASTFQCSHFDIVECQVNFSDAEYQTGTTKSSVFSSVDRIDQQFSSQFSVRRVTKQLRYPGSQGLSQNGTT